MDLKIFYNSNVNVAGFRLELKPVGRVLPIDCIKGLNVLQRFSIVGVLSTKHKQKYLNI